MAREVINQDTYSQEDHQVAYVFDPEDDGTRQKPAKRRRRSKQGQDSAEIVKDSSAFVPLLNGAEKPEFVKLRERLFQESWAKIDERIERILKTSNIETLNEVSEFAKDAVTESGDRIPSAFIITGPNIASQDLLFQQLSETLQQTTSSKFVGLRSSEASTLKATLKKIIRDVTAKASTDEDDDLEVSDGREGRRYLDYDLEALYAFIKPQNVEHVFVAFQDSEGFDSTLGAPRIPFTLLFGVATSVELLQARLLKASCQQIYGAQFDVIQTSTILETVFKTAVATSDAPVVLGASLIRSLLDRQHDQVSGIQTFTMSLKYAYMCHFYANPLSVLEHTASLQAEHIEAIRHTDSFRENVEQAVESGILDNVQYAKGLLENDEFLVMRVQDSLARRQESVEDFLRSLLILGETESQDIEFSRAYAEALDEGVSITENSRAIESVRRMDVGELLVMLRKVLQSKAEEQGITLRSKYSGQSKVMRTTVIAQRVQLSQDSAALTDEDKQLTQAIDDLTGLLVTHVQFVRPRVSFVVGELVIRFSSSVARCIRASTTAVLERGLTRPHDYLSCSCCKPGDGETPATLPATALLYRLYTETGSLINVADLWAAFSALVSEEETDERKSLVMFYRALAELRALGFVKASKKKADHIAKLKWL
ncbi:origin recognition complex subunit 3 [Fusarium oxysporum]|nr:origin recognition complex subunit 3 [Fusarium oxysporum]